MQTNTYTRTKKTRTESKALGIRYVRHRHGIPAIIQRILVHVRNCLARLPGTTTGIKRAKLTTNAAGISTRHLGDNFKPIPHPMPTEDDVARCKPLYEQIVNNGFLPFAREALIPPHKPVVVEETDRYITFSTTRMIIALARMSKDERQPILDQWNTICELANVGYRCHIGWARNYVRLYKPQTS